MEVDFLYDLFCVFFYDHLDSKSWIFCTAMTGIDEALDDTFLFYFDIPVSLQSLTGVVTSSLFIPFQSFRGDT